MHFKLICPSGDGVYGTLLQNAGYDRAEVVEALAHLAERGHSHEVLDGAALSDDERKKLIDDAVIVSVWNHVPVTGVFGSRKYKWVDFGTRVPALIVYGDERAVGVYPHKVGGGFRTIAKFLDGERPGPRV